MKHKAHKTRRMILLSAAYPLVSAGLAISQCGALPSIPRIACEAAAKAGASRAQRASLILATGPSDAIHAKLLDPSVTPDNIQPLSSLGRASDGSFILKPGSYEAYVESYYFDDQDAYRPADGAFLPAPILGARAAILTAVLKKAELHPGLNQQDIQQLVSAIYSGAYLEQMPLQVQQTAITILPQDIVRKLQANTLSNRVGKKVLDYLGKQAAGSSQTSSAPVNNTLASLQPLPPANVDIPLLARGTWAQMPGGFYVRYLPDGYMRTRVQVLVPPLAPGLSDPSHPLTFDPTQYLAITAQSPSLRLGITLRQIEVPKP